MRYFIGYHLDGRSAELVDGLRHAIADKFSVQGALRLPPHLSLFYPFEMEESNMGVLGVALAQFAQMKHPFKIKITGFNHFGETVRFIDVEQSEGLFDLKEGLVKVMREKFQKSEDTQGRKDIHFYVTLAYKDVTPEKFKLIGDYLSRQIPPIEVLNINAITLFKYQGEKWEAIRKFDLGNFTK